MVGFFKNKVTYILYTIIDIQRSAKVLPGILQNQNSKLCLSLNNTYQLNLTPDLPVRKRNGEESLKEEILKQSFEKNQLNKNSPMKEGMYGILLTSEFLFYNELLVPLCFNSPILLTNIMFILFP